MAVTHIATLRALGETEWVLNDPTQDIRGRKVIDRNDEEIGNVEELMVDEDEHRVRFLRLQSGGFLGIGASTFWIPVDAISGVTPSRVQIDRERTSVAKAPGYDPAIADDGYQESLYRHYGYAPYWSPSYSYPVFDWRP